MKSARKAQNAGGAAVSLVQWVRFGSGGFMQIVGVGPRRGLGGSIPALSRRARRHRAG